MGILSVIFCLCVINFLCVLGANDVGKKTADSWNVHEQCGRELHSYGGVLNFDATRLRSPRCVVTIVGKGVNDTMLSLYFTAFNVSEGCLANLTVKEPFAMSNPSSPFDSRGLYLSFCRNNYYLNENLMYTTDHNVVKVVFDGSLSSKMRYTLKFVAFTTRIRGCEKREVDNGMFSCQSGRCVHTDVLCKDLNPCGDLRDCNVTSTPYQSDEESRGLHYVNFVVIFAVVIFAVFALIQITLIVRNEQPVCYRKDKKIRIDNDARVQIAAELIPIKNDRRVDDYIIEHDGKL